MRRIGADDATSNSRIASLKPFLLDNGSMRNNSLRDDGASHSSVPYTSRTRHIMNAMKSRKAAQRSNDTKILTAPSEASYDMANEKDKMSMRRRRAVNYLTTTRNSVNVD